jgi:cell division ATPase FtsA
MDKTKQIVMSVKELEERFLDKDVDTGDPADDSDTGPLGDGDYNEFEAFTTVVSNSAQNCMIAIEQMLRGHKLELKELFGDEAEDILKQAQDALGAISDLFDGEEDSEGEDEEESEDEDEEEPEGKSEEEPKKEPESEEKPEEEEK